MSDSVRVFIVFFVVMSVIFFFVFRNRLGTPTNDVATSLEDPPRYVALAREGDAPYSSEMQALLQSQYPDLKPRISKLSPGRAFERVRDAVLLQEDWELVDERAAELRIELIARTRWLRFKDDVVIEVRPHEEGSVVHMRSRSRLGQGDLGANAKRIRAFLVSLDLSS